MINKRILIQVDHPFIEFYHVKLWIYHIYRSQNLVLLRSPPWDGPPPPWTRAGEIHHRSTTPPDPSHRYRR